MNLMANSRSTYCFFLFFFLLLTLSNTSAFQNRFEQDKSNSKSESFQDSILIDILKKSHVSEIYEAGVQLLEFLLTGPKSHSLDSSLSMSYRRSDSVSKSSTISPIKNIRSSTLNKRDSSSSASSSCNGVGVLSFSEMDENVCSGRYCKAVEADCSGTIVNVAQSSSSLWNGTTCKITKIQCHDTADINNDMEEQYHQTQCELLNVICTGQNSGNVVTGSAATIQQLQSCYAQLDCNDTYYGWSAFGFHCQKEQLVCNGVVIPPEQLNQTVTNNCIVSMVPCTSISKRAICPHYDVDCNSQGSCNVTLFRNYCKNTTSCHQKLNDTQCVCPIDYTGRDCKTQVPLNCSMELALPTPNCSNPYLQNSNDPKDLLLDGDRACLVFSLNEPANLGYYLNCNFSGPVTVPNVNFTYYISNKNFSVSLPANWTTQWGIFNFNSLSDKFTIKTNLTKGQMEGTELIWTNMTLGEIPDRYWHGNRVYGELIWGSSGPSVRTLFLGKAFLDTTEQKIAYPTQSSNKNTINIVLGVLLAVSVVALIVLCVVFRKRVKSALGYGED